MLICNISRRQYQWAVRQWTRDPGESGLVSGAVGAAAAHQERGGAGRGQVQEDAERGTLELFPKWFDWSDDIPAHHGHLLWFVEEIVLLSLRLRLIPPCQITSTSTTLLMMTWRKVSSEDCPTKKTGSLRFLG